MIETFSNNYISNNYVSNSYVAYINIRKTDK